MKKYVVLFIFQLLFLFSCMPVEADNSAICDFYLTDTTGSQTNIFSSGDSFYMQFYYVNTSSDTINYTIYDSRLAITFYIENDLGQRIASSIDGFGFRMAVKDYQLAPGDSLMVSWLAPTTDAQYPLVSLDAGLYRAICEFQGTPELIFPCDMEIIFNISE